MEEVTKARLTSPRAVPTLAARRQGARMSDNIVVQDSDDRPERMVRDPEGYFAEARRRAEIEVRVRRTLPAALRRLLP
jgi:hypothetical protein